MNVRLAEQGLGSVREFVTARLGRGELPADIARALSALTGQPIATHTLYEWIERWRGSGREAVA